MTAEDEVRRVLTTLNTDIAAWEQRRDAEAIGRLDECLSPDLVFRKADRTVVRKDTFMKALQGPSPFTSRESRDVAVAPFDDRALVTLTVVGTKADGSVGRYRNVRVFVRREGRWQLEVWFNDDVTSLPGLLLID